MFFFLLQAEKGRVFVGYQHREIGIFQRDGLLWEERGSQEIEAGDHPCSAMLLVAEETQLWIACGNGIFIADVTNPRTIAFVDSIEVVSHSNLTITSMVYQQGYIWCSLNSSSESQIIQYNENRECIGRFRLGHFNEIKVGNNLSISRGENSHDSREVYLTGKGELLDNRKPDFVQSLLVVDDTLWVGTVTGDIIVVAISSGDACGGVLGVLRIHPWLALPSGPVKHMILCGPDKVVACQMTKTYAREEESEVGQSQYQLIVWDKWDSKKFLWFRNVQRHLNGEG